MLEIIDFIIFEQTSNFFHEHLLVILDGVDGFGVVLFVIGPVAA